MTLQINYIGMAEPEEDVYFDALEIVGEDEFFIEALEQAPLTWDYTLREGHLIPEAHLIQQVRWHKMSHKVSQSSYRKPVEKKGI